MRSLSDRVTRLGAAVYYDGLRTLRVPAVSRWLHDAGVILCYHNVVVNDEDAIGTRGLHIARDRFERQMRWLADHYDVVSLSEFGTRISDGAHLRKTAAVTFDDAYAGVFEHAVPLLRGLGLPATIFVVADAPSQPIGFWWDRPEAGERAASPSHLPADWDTIRAGIGGGIEVGVHSAMHASLPTLSGAALDHEIVASRILLHRATGIWAESFAYPYGDWDPRVRAAVRAAGYRLAVTTDAGLNDARTDPWSMRRINVPAGIGDAAFEAWTAGMRGHGSLR